MLSLFVRLSGSRGGALAALVLLASTAQGALTQRAESAVPDAASVSAREESLAAARADLPRYDGRALGQLLGQWGCTSCDDIDGDCDVDADDLRLLIRLWGTILPTFDKFPCEPGSWKPQENLDVPDYDFQWVTITHPDNPGIPAAITTGPAVLGTGRVVYEYRMSVFEVSTTQFAEFLNALKPHIPDEFKFDRDITGLLILAFGTPDVFTYRPLHDFYPGSENAPVNTSYWMALRYVNWLHNNKGTALADFETGVYDLTGLPSFNPSDINRRDLMIERAPGARFWLPTHSEWAKAAHWDPENPTPESDGWWFWPYARNTIVPNGLPEDGGISNRDMGSTSDLRFFRPDAFVPIIGSYDVSAPWGMRDVSGGVSEWTEEGWDKSISALNFNPQSPVREAVIHLGVTGTMLNRGDRRTGIRLASAIPARSPQLRKPRRSQRHPRAAPLTH